MATTDPARIRELMPANLYVVLHTLLTAKG